MATAPMRLFTTLLLLAGGLGAFFWLRMRDEDAVVPVPEEQAQAVQQPSIRPSTGRQPLDELPVAEDAAPQTFARPSDRPPRNWIEQNNEATRLLKAGELLRAVELLEGCHAAVPEEDAFRRNLAEACVRLARHEHDVEGELDAAVAHLERAIEVGHDRRDVQALRDLLERWRREADVGRDHWTDSSLYFELSYDAERADILSAAQEVLDHLERCYGDLRDWFGVDPVIEEGRPRLRVVLYGPGEFDRVTGLGDWAGGVFDGVVRVSVSDLQRERSSWERTLRHELVHAFVHEVGGNRVPGWLNEGLAQWLEASSGADRARRVERARQRMGTQPPFPFSRLQGSLATWSDTDAIRRAYAQSLLLVHAIVTGANRGGEEALRRMVQAGRGGGDAGVGAGHRTSSTNSSVSTAPVSRQSSSSARSGRSCMQCRRLPAPPT